MAFVHNPYEILLFLKLEAIFSDKAIEGGNLGTVGNEVINEMVSFHGLAGQLYILWIWLYKNSRRRFTGKSR
jgi:hypothetical protein